MKKALPFLPAVLFYGIIFFLSSRPLDLGVSFPGFDKLAHGAAYGILGFLLALGFFRTLRAPLKTIIGGVFSAGVLLGILDEVHQIFVPGRNADARDAAADAAGVILGLAMYRLIFRKRQPEKHL